MKKPSVIQFTAGLTITMSVGANVWYGVDMMHRGGIQLIVVGVWMPVILALLERVLHASSAGKFFKVMLGFVAVCAMAYSMSHLAHLATPVGANLWEHISAWLFAITVDVAMVLAGWALMKRIEAVPASAVLEIEELRAMIEDLRAQIAKPIEQQVEIVVEAPQPEPVYAPFVEPIRVQAHVEEETETITETRQVTRTRRSSLTEQQQEQIVELGLAGHKPAEILRKLGIEGKQTNYITRSPAWARVLELRG